jgi:hypothetical protein
MAIATRFAPLLCAAALLAVLGTTLGGSPRALADNGTGGESLSVTIPWSGTLTCTMHGNRLHSMPTVHHGNKLHCTATRFSPGERVTVTVQSAPRNLGSVTADSAGTVVYDFSVPRDLADGAHTLTLTGATSDAVATYPFTVATGSGSGGVGGSGDGSGGSGVAFTGAQILSMLAAALVLIGGGGLLIAAGRRREQRKHA